MRLENQIPSLVWQSTSCVLLVCPLYHLISFLTNEHPASSCDVECGFSWGGLTISKLQHRLSDESTCASTVLHAWSEIPGLIPESEIIQVFKDKCHRLNAKDSGSSGQEKEKTVNVVDSDSGASDGE